jgi:hypothetical protein
MWVDLDRKMYSDKNLEFISLEQEFDIPMPMPSGKKSKMVRLGGRFDGIVKHVPSDTYWIWETKTSRSIQELVRSLTNDEQCGVYAYAASQMLGVPITGILYNILRKKVPTEPKLLSGGTLSKAANVDCTAFFYIKCIHDIYPDWEPDTIQGFYGDILEVLTEKETTFFQRFPVYRTKYEISRLMENIYYTSKEMLVAKDKPTMQYPAPSWLNCQFCHFRSPCVTMNAGGDFEVLLREEYQNRESTHSIRSEASSTDEN